MSLKASILLLSSIVGNELSGHPNVVSVSSFLFSSPCVCSNKKLEIILPIPKYLSFNTYKTVMFAE